MIVVCCGLPAAGKTTLTTGLRERLAERGREVALLHSDDFERRTYDRMHEAVAEAPDRDWVLDGTFYARRHRNRLYGLGEVRVVWVRASVETCLARNREREGSVPDVAIHSIAAEFEPPRADLELDTETLDPEAALDRLEAAVVAWLAD